jgi:hypothetical protein
MPGKGCKTYSKIGLNNKWMTTQISDIGISVIHLKQEEAKMHFNFETNAQGSIQLKKKSDLRNFQKNSEIFKPTIFFRKVRENI